MFIVILSKTVKSGEPLVVAASFLRQVVFGSTLIEAPAGQPASCNIVVRGLTTMEGSMRPQGSSVPGMFSEMCCALEPYVTGSPVEIWVDEADLMNLNPLLDQPSARWESVLAACMLSFPDVIWRVGLPRGRPSDPEGMAGFDRVAKLLSISRRDDDSAGGLFDGDGLRDWIRGRMVSHPLTAAGGANLRRRRLSAVALDEETTYAYLHAYTAYRYGLRAATLSTGASADGRLKDDSTCEPPTFVFEDHYLNFADGAAGMSDLKARARRWPRLEKAEGRIFVTAGQRLAVNKDRDASNKEYLDQLRARKVDVRTVPKPYAGMWDLSKRSRLTKMRAFIADQPKEKPLGYSRLWTRKRSDAPTSHHDHSCPGMLLMIAQMLMQRCKKLLPEVHAVEDAVRGAVMATDAWELLGTRTPTASIEALRLKHHFEILAECQFSGVEYHIRMHGRFKEIKQDVASVSRWFYWGRRGSAALNARMFVLGALAQVCREYGQFDEEQMCVFRIRHLHDTLWLRQGLRNWKWVLPPIHRSFGYVLLLYVELVMKSLTVYGVVILGWLFALGYLFNFHGGHEHWASGFFDSVSSFFSQGAPIHPEDVTSGVISAQADHDPQMGWPFVAVTCTAIVAGFFHLGLFVSHLYTILSRR